MEKGNSTSKHIRLLGSIKSLEQKIDKLTREFKLRQVKDPQFIILDNADFIRMFNISSRTAQNWREEGLIEYSQVKGKIYYRLTDVQRFLENHKGRK